MKKFLTLGILALGIFVLSGCTQKQVEQNLLKTDTDDQAIEQGIKQEGTQSQDIVYSSSKYQFSLKLPAAWEGYKVSEKGNNGTLCFYLPEAGDQNFCLFQLYVSAKGKTLPSALQLVGENNDWQIASDKSATTCAQLNTVQCTRAKEATQIFETFAAIK